MKIHAMNPDKAASKGTVESRFILFTIQASKVYERISELMAIVLKV